MTTLDSITNGQIHALMEEANNAGDMAMVLICSSAMYSPNRKERDIARAKCVEVIAAAEAMQD